MEPFIQWAIGAPAVMFGMAIGAFWTMAEVRPRQMGPVVIVASVLIMSLCVEVLEVGTLGIPYAVAALLICAHKPIGQLLDRWGVILGPLTYGVYLVHPIISGLLWRMVDHWGIRVMGTIVLSFVVVYLIRRSPLRWTV